MEWNERNERNAREKCTHRRVTANVWVLTVCSTHTVPYNKNRQWVARKFVFKLNDCIQDRKIKCEATQTRAPVAKHVHRLTSLNCSLATCFAARVHSKLQLLKVSSFFK